MKLEVRINEDDFHGVRGRSCQGTFALRQSIFHGRVTKILPERMLLQEYLVHLDVDMGGEALYAGMSGEEFGLGSAPELCNSQTHYGNKVFVGAGRVKAREVQIGFLD